MADPQSLLDRREEQLAVDEEHTVAGVQERLMALRIADKHIGFDRKGPMVSQVGMHLPERAHLRVGRVVVASKVESEDWCKLPAPEHARRVGSFQEEVALVQTQMVVSTA